MKSNMESIEKHYPNMETVEKHISLVKAGDTILHNGDLVTVGPESLKRGFMGITIRGDSYRLGTKLVKVVTFKTVK